jgi:hypothetical protein
MTDTSRHYVDNKKLLQAIIEYQASVALAKETGEEVPRITEYIGECFLLIASQLSLKHNFVNYSYRDEMVSDAIENCLLYMHNFDPTKSSNPFAYFTQISYYAFLRRIKKEKRQAEIKGRYIESLDIESFLSTLKQNHDDMEYRNTVLDYLRKQVDSEEITEYKGKTRKPKYLNNEE